MEKLVKITAYVNAKAWKRLMKRAKKIKESPSSMVNTVIEGAFG